MSFIEELLKTKSILQLLNGKLKEGAPDIDVIDYTSATTMLESKLAILTALNISVEGDGDEKVSFNLYGSGKSIVIDKAKMKEAITIQDNQVKEKIATAEDHKIDFEELNIDALGEDEYVKRAVAAIGEVKKTANKTLEKDTFVKVFKYTGEFAKFRGRQMKKAAQEKRCEAFGGDAKAYLEALKKNIQEEEKAYEQSSGIMFDALSISSQCFEKTQNECMNDPYVSMELFNLGISMEKPNSPVPEELTVQKTIDLVKQSNDYAFDLFKKEYLSQLSGDPMLMPVLISAIAHDWVKVNHGFDEDSFKAALFEHKIYENPEVSMHMQMKQQELMMLAMQQNPMAMGMPGGMEAWVAVLLEACHSEKKEIKDKRRSDKLRVYYKRECYLSKTQTRRI
jgi:hypothetical protein